MLSFDTRNKAFWILLSKRTRYHKRNWVDSYSI